MSDVRGPFIEYECNHCGCTTKEKIPNDYSLIDKMIRELKEDEQLKICENCEWVDV